LGDPLKQSIKFLIDEKSKSELDSTYSEGGEFLKEELRASAIAEIKCFMCNTNILKSEA